MESETRETLDELYRIRERLLEVYESGGERVRRLRRIAAEADPVIKRAVELIDDEAERRWIVRNWACFREFINRHPPTKLVYRSSMNGAYEAVDTCIRLLELRLRGK